MIEIISIMISGCGVIAFLSVIFILFSDDDIEH
jgi:hypothetical protein